MVIISCVSDDDNVSPVSAETTGGGMRATANLDLLSAPF